MNKLYTMTVRTYQASGTIVTAGERDLREAQLDERRQAYRSGANVDKGETVEITVTEQR